MLRLNLSQFEPWAQDGGASRRFILAQSREFCNTVHVTVLEHEHISRQIGIYCHLSTVSAPVQTDTLSQVEHVYKRGERKRSEHAISANLTTFLWKTHREFASESFPDARTRRTMRCQVFKVAGRNRKSRRGDRPLWEGIVKKGIALDRRRRNYLQKYGPKTSKPTIVFNQAFMDQLDACKSELARRILIKAHPGIRA